MDPNKESSDFPNPFFSIGVTTYNRKDLLKQSVLSLLDQSFTDFEIIIGNDYIEENLTPEKLGINDSRIRIINNSQNLGELENMNSLLKLANGKYFTWQFDDDLCAPALLNTVYSALMKYDFPLCAFTSYKFIYSTSKQTVKKKSIQAAQLFSGSEFLRRYLSGKLKAPGAGGFYNTNYLKNLGGALRLSNGHMALYSEYFLLIKCGLLTSVAYINSPLISVRIHDNSWSSSSVEVDLFKQAGIALVRQSLNIFSLPELKEDFDKNLSSLLKSVICAVIVKSAIGSKHSDKKEVSDYVSLIRDECNLLKDSDLNERALTCLNIATKNIPWFNIKAKLKLIIPDKHLKFARFGLSLISGFLNKSF